VPRQGKKTASYLDLMSKYLVQQRGRVVALGALILAGIALQLAGPQILRFFIDSALSGKPLAALTVASGVYIAIALAGQLIGVLTTFISEKVGWTATNALRGDLLSHCLKLDMAFHKEHLPGEMIERIDGDTTALSNLFTKFIVTVLANLLLIAGMIVLLLSEDTRIGAGMGLFALAALVILLKVQARAVPHWVRVRKARAEFYGLLGEQVASVDDIGANGAVPYAMNRFHTMLRNMLPMVVRANLMSYAMWITTIIVFTSGYALTCGISWYLWSQGKITIGTAYLIYTYTNLLNMPIEQVRVQLEDLQKAGASIKRINGLLELRSGIKDGEATSLPAGALSLEIRGLSFSYEAEQHVLDDVSIRIEPGRILGVLGRTGGGKTTLSRLLNRFYDPDAGEITLGGSDLRAIRIEELRSRVAYVTQDVQLLKASIRDNLTFFDASIPDLDVLEAIDDVGLSGWLAELPDGLDTVLGSDGGGLSAGQGQLLALARAFLRAPGFVILDEASSRLDPITEGIMEGAMDRLLSGRTALIIAHRLKTLDRADDILILGHGKVLEYGERAALAADPDSQYAKLLKGGMEEMLA